MKKSLWISVAVLSLAVSAMAEPPTAPQGGRPSIFASPVTPGPLADVFKKNGNDWQIVVIHGAIDTFAGAH